MPSTRQQIPLLKLNIEQNLPGHLFTVFPRDLTSFSKYPQVKNTQTTGRDNASHSEVLSVGLLGLALHEAQLNNVYTIIKGRFGLNLAINNN